MNRFTVELGFLVAGLVFGLALTWACAWAYPIGRGDIWLCGSTALVATVLMSLGTLRRAWRADRTAR